MRQLSRWSVVALFILFSVLLFSKGLDLWFLRSHVDGDGVGVHFLGMELNDRVPAESIHSYAIGFFVFGLISFIMAIVLISLRFRQVNRR
ncbi:hypothetical protein [Salinibacillus xinjiangensis]|uniref:DUF4306 domain-containing protein n=1 Tax=Salinibacillus xinjiangensis TaxID=1229268 RepID=A0A6G1X550_9BACI|nr:hypothetical protein [Salinibacillus xinjiangensis]MRG86067.1 hypothetical protein [Salinibacillus xinjiangensis]